jgi:hypothetical protein
VRFSPRPLAGESFSARTTSTEGACRAPALAGEFQTLPFCGSSLFSPEWSLFRAFR